MDDKHDLSRRGFLGAAAGVTAAAAVGASTQAAHGQPGSPPPGASGGGDLALVNGKIHTFDEGNRVVSQVLIRDGRFAAVGSVGGGAPQVINLHGRTVIPGLIDNHCHFVRIGQAAGYDMRRLETAFSIEEAQAVIAAYAAEIPEGEWLTALAGIARRQFADPARFPTREELDDAAPNHPVVISELFAAQTNTLGRDRLRDLGVDVADDGTMAQGNAYNALSQFITMETKKREQLRVSEYALSVGLTTVMDDHGNAGGPAGILDRVTGHDHVVELWREGRLPVRLRNRFAVQQGLDDPELLQLYVNHRWEGFGDDMMINAGIGEWAPRGELYQNSLRIMAERSYLYHQHLISTGEIQNHLDAFQQFIAENPNLPHPSEMHWNLGHISGITEAQVHEANALGVGLAPHGWNYLTSNSPGPHWRMIVDLATVPVGTGLDFARVAPMYPWANVYFMVTGRNSGGALVGEDRRISREEAVRLYAGPQQGWFSKEEDRLGGIGVGRYADLVVLDKDFFDRSAVPDEDIRRMRSVLTIVGGKVRYDAGVL